MALQTFEEKKAFVQKFNVFDDTFFEMVAKDKDAVEDILRIIFHEPGLEIIELIPQNSVKNFYGRSVRLDALCKMEDGEKIIYVNGSTNVAAAAEDKDMAELMAYFNNSNGINEKFKNLSERVNELKNEEREVLAMCKLVEDYAKAQLIETAKTLISIGTLSDEQISVATKLSINEVKSLHSQNSDAL